MWPGFPVPKTATLPPQTPPVGGITINPAQIPPIITISMPPVFEMPKFEFHSSSIEPDKCTCDIMKLMAVGCKCGQFQREQSKK